MENRHDLNIECLVSDSGSTFHGLPSSPTAPRFATIATSQNRHVNPSSVTTDMHLSRIGTQNRGNATFQIIPVYTKSQVIRQTSR